MNTYIKTQDSQQFAAMRNVSAKQISELKLEKVPATKKLRDLAKIGAIVTYRVSNNVLVPL